ncbi:hypothetical protein [Corallococcus macrosporus]|uniref:Putative lipoprotein n=1 Tax=Myxococcus fulvus (strain ATCC BAA-855 / HW-1) TaxID=483219 RepID=F8CJT9_MYXFH|nr:hypothetical protein [Corallococcus macrosporus]AEI65116.1 putative lipoprotein [Corallococcus macrosporus]
MSRPTLSSWKQAAGGLALASVIGLGCESPPVVPTADVRQNTRSARIDGSLVVQSRARGNAIVFLYDADRPPPPHGTGRPITFTVVPAAQLFGPALTSDTPGPFVAPFSFSLVPTGRYMLRGFIDADGCATDATEGCRRSDFNPWYGVTNEPNAGDVGGAAVDATGRPLTLEVVADADGQPQPVTGVAVSVSDTARVVRDRPTFQVVQGDGLLGGAPKQLRLQPLALHDGVVDQRPDGFAVSYVDADNDGVPDDANQDSNPDGFWPRVVVRKLAGDASNLVDENDLDRDGVPDDTGVDYAHADGTQDGQPDVVVLAARLLPDPLIAALTDENGNPRMEGAVVPELVVEVLPQALDARVSTNPVPLRELPRGRYAVVLIQPSGQTWRVPNELAPALASGLGLPALESQAFVLEVP